MKNKIVSISATNLKGSSFEQPLSDITLFHGANFAGKTTRIEALALALCHQVPGVAVRAGDIYELFATGHLGVRAVMENRDYAGADWTKGRKGIETEFTGLVSAPSLLFNTSEFLDLSPKERTKFLFSVLPPPPLDKVGPEAIITNLKNVKLEPHTEAAELAVNEFCEQVRASFFGKSEQRTIQEWLQNLVEEIASSVKEAKASAKTMRQTALGTTALRSDAPSLALMEETKRKAQDALTNSVRDEQEALTAFSTAERAVQEAKKIIEAFRGSPAEDYETPLKTEKAELEAFIAREDVILEKAITSTQEGEAWQIAKTRLSDAKREWQEAKLAVHEFDALECCPTCKAKAKGWKAAVLETLQAKVVEANSKVEIYVGSEAAAKTAYDLAQEKVNAEGMRIQNIRSSRKRLAEVVTSLSRYAEQESKAAPANEAREQLPELQSKVQKASLAFTEAQTKTLNAKKTLGDADAKHREAIADAANARQSQQATEQAVKIEAKAEVGQQLRDMLHELLQLCVKQSISPLLELCNDLCGDILPAPLGFVDGEIVMVNLNMMTRHSHKTFSGTERALTYAALSVGLATQSPLKLVILDELGRLDYERKAKLVKRLADLIASGKIDQAILVDTQPMGKTFQEAYGLPKEVTFSQVEITR